MAGACSSPRGWDWDYGGGVMMTAKMAAAGGRDCFSWQHKTHFVTSLEQLPGKLELRFDTIAINCSDVSERAGGGLPLGRAGRLLV